MIIYGSTAQDVLKQKAVLTFTLLRAGRSVERKRKGALFAELCDIAYIPSQKNRYYQELRAIYEKRQGIEKRPAVHVPLTDPNLGKILSGILG